MTRSPATRPTTAPFQPPPGPAQKGRPGQKPAGRRRDSGSFTAAPPESSAAGRRRSPPSATGGCRFIRDAGRGMRAWNVPIVAPESHVKGRENGSECSEIDENTCLNAPAGGLSRPASLGCFLSGRSRGCGTGAAVRRWLLWQRSGAGGGCCGSEYAIDGCRVGSRSDADYGRRPASVTARQPACGTVLTRHVTRGRPSTAHQLYSRSCDPGPAGSRGTMLPSCRDPATVLPETGKHATPPHATLRHATPPHATPRQPRQAKPSQATPSQATPSQTTPSHAEPSHAKPSQAKPYHAPPRHATQRQAKPSRAEPSHAISHHGHAGLRSWSWSCQYAAPPS